MKAKYYLGTFSKDKEVYMRIYFICYKKKEIEDFIQDAYKGGKCKIKLTPCKENDLDGLYWTDGYRSMVLVGEDMVYGKMDLRTREFLVEWEQREHDGEYARVLRRQNFIVTATTSRNAGCLANEYAIARRYGYCDDYTFYFVTENEDEIARVKAEKNYVAIR